MHDGMRPAGVLVRLPFSVDSHAVESYYHAADGSGAVSQVRARPAPRPSVAFFPVETQETQG